jgi:hypothetical protein
MTLSNSVKNLLIILLLFVTGILIIQQNSSNTIAEYQKEFIVLTYEDSKTFQEFLTTNNGKKVTFNTTISFDAATDVNQRIHDACNYEEIIDTINESPELIEKTPIGLPEFQNSDNTNITCSNQLKIKTKDPRALRFSHGGTGIIHLPLHGTFLIEVRQFSGPITEFTLREI